MRHRVFLGREVMAGSAAMLDYVLQGRMPAAHCTGRQLPPLSSVLYRIISKRRSVLAAQLLLREKSGA
jgi:hypothetical protein